MFFTGVIYLFLTFFFFSSAKISDGFDVKVVTNHQLDSVNLLVYTLLMVLSILTAWVFKQRRFKFFHETGLVVIYGLVVGALIAYTVKKPEQKIQKVVVSLNESIAPDILQLQILDPSNASTFHKYSYHSRVDKSDKSQELQDKVTFDPEIFFNVILPPIIFNAGYQMKRKHFFKNIGSILTFAFLGTTISALSTAALMFGFCKMFSSTNIHLFSDCFFFGAIISATDPVTILAIFNALNVDVDMYALVFGESILNDAVAIVLATSIENYKSISTGFDGLAILKSFGYFLQVFFGSLSLGTVMGCLTALFTKFTKLRNFVILETSLFILMSYAAFLAAESLKLSGIVSVLFCGICQAHYTYNNLSTESQHNTREIFHLLAFLMESFVFLYIGVSTFTFRSHNWDLLLIISALVSVILGRAANIYPLSFLLNFGRSHKITCNMQHVMMFSGLRGAMAFALAIRNTSSLAHRTILTCTVVIVISTVVLCGGLTTQVLYWFKIRVGVHELDYRVNLDNEPLMDDVPIDPNIAQKSKFTLMWSGLDKRFFKPLLTHHMPPLTETMPSFCRFFSYMFTTSEQMHRIEANEPPATFSSTQQLSINTTLPKGLDPNTPLIIKDKTLDDSKEEDYDYDQELLILSDENN